MSDKNDDKKTENITQDTSDFLRENEAKPGYSPQKIEQARGGKLKIKMAKTTRDGENYSMNFETSA